MKLEVQLIMDLKTTTGTHRLRLGLDDLIVPGLQGALKPHFCSSAFIATLGLGFRIGLEL